MINSDIAKAYLLVTSIHKDQNFDQLPSELKSKILEIEELLHENKAMISPADLVWILQLITLLSDLVKPG